MDGAVALAGSVFVLWTAKEGKRIVVEASIRTMPKAWPVKESCLKRRTSLLPNTTG